MAQPASALRPAIELARQAGGATVSTMYLAALEAFLEQCGLGQVSPRLTHAGMPAGARLPGALLCRQLDAAAAAAGRPELGLAFGDRIGGAGFGMLGLAATSAPTLGAAIQQLIGFESLASTLGHTVLADSRDGLRLAWLPQPGVPPSVVEAVVAGWVSFGRYLLGGEVEVRSVALAHPRQGAAWTYDALLRCPVRFSAGWNGLCLEPALLDAQPRFADPRLHAALGGWLGHALAGTRRETTAAQAVARSLGQRTPHAFPDEADVAASLGLERRSLQRALRSEQTSFRQILGAYRAQDTLVQLLLGEASLLDVSARAGFAEQSSLCRAVRQWSGHAPQTLRVRLGGVFRSLREVP